MSPLEQRFFFFCAEGRRNEAEGAVKRDLAYEKDSEHLCWLENEERNMIRNAGGQRVENLPHNS